MKPYEIKFKGISKETGSEVLGNLVHKTFDGSKIVAYAIKPIGCYPTEVDKESINCTIGVKDKNDNPIWSDSKLKVTHRCKEYITTLIRKGAGYVLKENKTILKDGVLIPSMLEIVN